MIVLKVANRILAFVGKEVMEALRRPAGMASLVLGPFLIMAVFGLGYGGYGRPLTTEIVVPDGSSLSMNVEDYREYEQEGLRIVGVTRDVEEARAMLRDGTAEIAVIAPTNAAAALRDGQQSDIRIEYSMVDPFRAGFVQFVGRQLSAEINREIITALVEQGQEIALRESGQSDFTALPPDVIASPTRPVDANLAATAPAVVSYYGPALVALILQHLAMTLAGLSLVRERTTGAIEVLRVSPISASEIVAGKLFGYAAIVGLVAVATFGILIGVVGVPDLAGVLPIAGIVALSTVASVGIGLLLAVISDSERQIVQLTLLVLLASIFFSGLIIPVADFTEPVQVAAGALPATHTIQLLQDMMLAGYTNNPSAYLALAAIAVVGLGFAWLLLRRGMSRT